MSLCYWSPCKRFEIYNSRAEALLPILRDKTVDVVVDPPYGIGQDERHQKNRAGKKDGRAFAASKEYGSTAWDREPISHEALWNLHRVGVNQIIFGGNYFPLPPSRCWLVWDKLNGENDYADAELAWTNLDKPVRVIRFLWHGMLRDEKGERVHPTQKPIGVMRWAISQLPKATRPILDSHMGSGSTGVAALRMGRRFIGYEPEEKYFEIAKRRLTEALDADPLFAEKETVDVVQSELFQ